MDEQFNRTDFDESDFEIPDEHLVALGRITYEYASLDHALKSCVGAMLTTDGGVNDIVCASTPFRALLDLAWSLATYRYGESQLATDLKAAIREAQRAATKRNTIVHSMWLVNPRPADNFSVRHGYLSINARREKGLQYDGKSVEPDELIAIAEGLGEAARTLFGLRSKLDCTTVSEPEWWRALEDDDEDSDGVSIPVADLG